jgi:hypothetical protein
MATRSPHKRKKAAKEFMENSQIPAGGMAVARGAAKRAMETAPIRKALKTLLQKRADLRTGGDVGRLLKESPSAAKLAKDIASKKLGKFQRFQKSSTAAKRILEKGGTFEEAKKELLKVRGKFKPGAKRK